MNGIWSNNILISSILAWAVAQVIKAFLFAIINKRFDFSRLFGDGGMPSCHSATVTAMAASAALSCGLSSPVFAVAAITAIIVMHDAMGVRLETGKQAKLLNELVAHITDSSFSHEEKLKELVGHTPLQVVCGALVGLIVAFIVNLLL